MTSLLKQIIHTVIMEDIEDPENPKASVDDQSIFDEFNTLSNLEDSQEELGQEEEEEENERVKKEVDDAFGSKSSTPTPTVKKEKKKTIITLKGLYNNANTLGITGDTFISWESESHATEIATALSNLITNFRKEKYSQLVSKFNDGNAPDPTTYLTGPELVKNIETSLIRCKLYFWSALTIYQNFKYENTAILKDKDKKTSEYATMDPFKLGSSLLNPNEKDLKDIYYIFQEMSPKQPKGTISPLQSKIVSKKDLLTKFLSANADFRFADNSKVMENTSSSVLKALKETYNKNDPYERARRAAESQKLKAFSNDLTNNTKLSAEEHLMDLKTKEQEAKGNIEVAPSSTYVGDAVSKTEDFKNQLFNRYFQGFIAEYFYATPENIGTIDERIYKNLSNPISILKVLKTRRADGQRYETKGMIKEIGTEKQTIRNASVSLDDINNTEKLAQKSSYLLNLDNKLHDFFNSYNFASCVGEFLERWAKEPSKFLVKIFNKETKKLEEVNLLAYLYKQSSSYIETSGTTLTELQIDIISCVSNVITLDGEPSEITPAIIANVELEITKIINEYELSEFSFIKLSNSIKEAARQAFNLTGFEKIEKANRLFLDTAEKGTFKERLITKISEITLPEYVNIKDSIIEQLEALTDPSKILEVATRVLGALAVERLLRDSSDATRYSNKKVSDAELILKEVSKKLEYFMELDPTNKTDMTPYLLFNGLKINKKGLALFLHNLTLANSEKLQEFILSHKKFKAFPPSKSSAKEATEEALNKLIEIKRLSLTESTETAATLSDALKQAAIHTFVESLIPQLQVIGSELNKFGLFLISVVTYPTYYIETIKSTTESARKFKFALRNYKLPLNRIKELVTTYYEVKDSIGEMTDLLDNPVFKSAFDTIKNWLLNYFRTDDNVECARLIDLAEEEHDWKPLKKFLHDNWERIQQRLTAANGQLTAIGKLISNLIFHSSMYEKPYKKAKLSNEESDMNAAIMANVKGTLKSSMFDDL